MNLFHKGRTYCKYGLLLVCICLFYGKTVGSNPCKPTIESKVRLFLDKADACIRNYNPDQAKIHLDSASLYKTKVDNPDILGFLYSKYGDYHYLKLNDSAFHQNYYKAIECYYKAGVTNSVIQIIQIYNNLAFSYIQKNDTESLKKIIDKMLALEQNKNADIINTYRIIAFYYSKLYEKDKKQTIFLDSAIYYDQQAISLYQDLTEPTTIRKEDMAYNHINLASNLFKKEYYDLNTIISYLIKSEELANPNDTAMILNQYWIKGLIAYKKGEIEKAKQLFNDQLLLMDNWIKGDPLFMYADVYQKLSEISEIQKDYNQALAYERKRNEYLNQIHDAQKYEIIRELETKYEVSRKEQEIVQLTKLNNFRERINYLYRCIFVLCLISFIFVFRWFRMKKKAAETQLALTLSEKNEVLLQGQLREEKLKKTELEKYEALLDSHFKNEQISEMDGEISGFKQEQQLLNTRINEYASKLKEYEKRKSLEIAFATNDPANTSILYELYELIKRKIKDIPIQKEYSEKLTAIYDSFFQKLRACVDGEELSVLDIKRCVAFVIGMEVRHMADVFSVEPSSIRQERYRLKIKLKVEKDMGLDLFLKQLFLYECESEAAI